MEEEIAFTTLNCGSRYEKLPNLIITKAKFNCEVLQDLPLNSM